MSPSAAAWAPIRWRMLPACSRIVAAVSISGLIQSINLAMRRCDRLSVDVAPGEESVSEAGFRLPDEPGRYRLEIDLVDEGLAWFSWDGSQPLFVDVDIVSV